MLVRAVRGGQVVGTTGPLLQLSVKTDGAEVFPGQMITGSTVMARLTVKAPAWVPVEEVRWYVDGRLHTAVPVSQPVRRQDSAALDAGEQTDIRVWELERSFTWKEDGFLMVEAGERLPQDPDQPPPEVGLYGRTVPHHWSLAFTNPVRVDADGDGRWQPGGGN